VSFGARTERRHTTSLALADALALETLVVLIYAGRPLADDHGGPIRTVVPGRYFYKSVKWLEAIRVLAADELGYWEREAGYHNQADPWQEQRYIVAQIDTATYRQLLHRKDFSGHTLLGLHAEGRTLEGLNARGATLRNAHFTRARLAGACFEGANLSNAHFEGADLCGVSFQAADLEGADFRGADLREADLTDASLCGVSFCPHDEQDPWGPAVMDHTTQIRTEALEVLTLPQQAFVERARRR
jgi:hypothetical protein